jgi:hypothetical protein
MSQDVRRGDKVSFLYFEKKQFRKVDGWVSEVTSKSIYVGNELNYILPLTRPLDGTEISHAKPYRVSEIHDLEIKHKFCQL